MLLVSFALTGSRAVDLEAAAHFGIPTWAFIQALYVEPAVKQLRQFEPSGAVAVT